MCHRDDSMLENGIIRIKYNVFIPHALDGTTPLIRAIKNIEELEEERMFLVEIGKDKFRY